MDILKAPMLAVRFDFLLLKYLFVTVIMNDGAEIFSPLAGKIVVLMQSPKISQEVIRSAFIQQPHALGKVRIGVKVFVHGFVEAVQAEEILPRGELKISRRVK